MPVLRRDATTGDWVILAPGREERPEETVRQAAGPAGSADCPLCPGHEAETPPEILRIPGEGGRWALRVVPNRFAVLSPAGGAAREVSEAPLFAELPGIGHHEVVVETPEHGRRMAEMSTQEVARVLDAYHARYLALRRDPGVAHLVAFKNSGERAGASLAHPHSQLVAMSVVPPGVERRLRRARAHHRRSGANLYRELADAEVAAGRRVVDETEDFVVYCPFASTLPYETWIVPRRDQASFGATSGSQRAALAGLLRSTLAALDDALDRPDFNYVLQTAPLSDEDAPFYLWHLRILPRAATLAGFELGTGIAIDTRRPGDAAAELRARLRSRPRSGTPRRRSSCSR